MAPERCCGCAWVGGSGSLMSEADVDMTLQGWTNYKAQVQNKWNR